MNSEGRSNVEQAAQLWCDPKHSHKTMDAELCQDIIKLLDQKDREKAEVEAELQKLKNCPNDHCMNLHKEISRQKDMITELFQKNSTAREAELEAALSLATGALRECAMASGIGGDLDTVIAVKDVVNHALSSPTIKAEVARLEEQVKDTERLNWIDQNASFVCNEPYRIGPYKVGELRKMADDGIAQDKHKSTTLRENLGQGHWIDF